MGSIGKFILVGLLFISLSACASAIIKHTGQVGSIKYGAIYSPDFPTGIVENAKLSGTRVEATVGLILDDAPTPNKFKDFKVEWMNLPEGQRVIHESTAETTTPPTFKFRYATTLVADGTILQFRITGKTTWGTGNPWYDVNETFSFEAYNKAQHFYASVNADSTEDAEFVTVNTGIFNAAVSMLNGSHTSSPNTASAALTETRANILAKVLASTVVVAGVHGGPTEFMDSHNIAAINFTQDIAPLVATKATSSPAIPKYNAIIFYTCSTLANGATGPASYGVDAELHRIFCGFKGPVANQLWSKQQWIDANEGETNKNLWFEFPPKEELNYSLADHAGVLFSRLMTGSTFGAALADANAEFPPLTASVEQIIESVETGFSGLSQEMEFLGENNHRTRLKFVYMDANQVNQFFANLNRWWIPL